MGKHLLQQPELVRTFSNCNKNQIQAFTLAIACPEFKEEDVGGRVKFYSLKRFRNGVAVQNVLLFKWFSSSCKTHSLQYLPTQTLD